MREEWGYLGGWPRELLIDACLVELCPCCKAVLNRKSNMIIAEQSRLMSISSNRTNTLACTNGPAFAYIEIKLTSRLANALRKENPPDIHSPYLSERTLTPAHDRALRGSSSGCNAITCFLKRRLVMKKCHHVLAIS